MRVIWLKLVFILTACTFSVSCNLAEDQSSLVSHCEKLIVRAFDFYGRSWEYIEADDETHFGPVYYPDIGEGICVNLDNFKIHLGSKYYSFNIDGKTQWFPETDFKPQKISSEAVKEIEIPISSDADIKYFHLPYSEIYLPSNRYLKKSEKTYLMMKVIRDSKVTYMEEEIDCATGELKMIGSGTSPHELYFLQQRDYYRKADGSDVFPVGNRNNSSLAESKYLYACENDQN